MKKYISIVIVSLLLFSCSKSKDNFSKYEWILHYKKYDENFNSTSHKRVLFRHDSAISYSDLQEKNISFSLSKKDSIIIFKQLYTIYPLNREKKDTIVIQTLLYDFKNMYNTPMLIIKPINSNNFNFLTTSETSIKIDETNNFVSNINFKIGGYQIGDTISMESLSYIKDKDDYDDNNLLISSLKENEDIELEIIDKNYVYNIKQKNIDVDNLENIVRVINEKIQIKPDTIQKKPPFYTEGFEWEKKGVKIRLSKKNMYLYYMDEVDKIKENNYINNIKKTLLLERATESIEKDKYFTLEYDNLLLQGVLQRIKKRKIQSSIIE